MILSNIRQRLSAVSILLLAALRRDRPAPIPADALTSALASLPEPSRTVYLLHARDHLPLSEVGRRLDLTAIDVTRHFSRALVHLDRQIGTISPSGTVASDGGER